MVMAGWMMMPSPVAMMIAPLRTARQAAPLPRPESEQAFSDWLKGALQDAPGSRVYPEVFAEAQECVVRWRRRYHGNARLWKQLFKSDKVIKELVEAAPVIAMARALVTSAKLPPGERFTVVDLCSGKGYLSMFLSEMLPSDLVESCILIDKSWPPHNQEAAPHHINNAHIYGPMASQSDSLTDASGGGPASYFETWPVPLYTIKLDLKKGRSARELESYLKRCSGPVLLLAVHLYGTLSLWPLYSLVACC